MMIYMVCVALIKSFNSLEMAINAYQNSQLSRIRFYFYIAPFIYQANIEDFLAQIERATQLGLPVHIWMVLEYPNTSTPYDASLREALEAGGGSLFYFSRDEELPAPNTYLEGVWAIIISRATNQPCARHKR